MAERNKRLKDLREASDLAARNIEALVTGVKVLFPTSSPMACELLGMISVEVMNLKAACAVAGEKQEAKESS